MIPVQHRIALVLAFPTRGKAAAREAVELGRRLNVPVTLLHAVGRITMPSAWDVMMAPTDAEREAQAKTNIQKLAASLGPPEPRTVAVIAEPGELMAQEAGSGTLVVLGLGDLSGNRPGSTAMRIMAETHLPVLAIPSAARSGS